jgi:repressor LexA
MGRKPLCSTDHVLAAINRFTVEHGLPPSIEELRGLLKIGSTRTVLRYLCALECEGRIRRWRGARGIQLLRRPTTGVETVSIPLVGGAPAGSAMFAEENREGWVRFPKQFIKSEAAKYFLLRVRGDSMNRARVEGGAIENGDLILVRQQSSAQPGDVVVALIDSEATIKRLVKGSGYWVLKPESTNSSHQPIVLNRDFIVQGIVVRVFRKGSELLGLLEQ